MKDSLQTLVNFFETNQLVHAAVARHENLDPENPKKRGKVVLSLLPATVNAGLNVASLVKVCQSACVCV